MPILPDGRFEVIHTSFPPCQKVAFTFDSMFDATQVSAATIRMPDGSRPVSGDSVRCGSCGQNLTWSDYVELCDQIDRHCEQFRVSKGNRD